MWVADITDEYNKLSGKNITSARVGHALKKAGVKSELCRRNGRHGTAAIVGSIFEPTKENVGWIHDKG